MSVKANNTRPGRFVPERRRSPRRWGQRLLVLLFAAGLALPSISAGPISHEDWSTVLRRFVTEDGWVNYEALAGDREHFDSYLQMIHSIDPASHPDLFPTRDDELAYYINAYNALVFEGVIARGPERESVWSGLVSGFKFFVRTKFSLGSRKISLKKLEDKIIRAEYQDPRIHAALNCASVGCPRLPQEPFLGARLDAQLDAAMREFVNTERHVRYNAADNTIALSRIFDWFEGDFLADQARVGSEKSLLAYINRYRDSQSRIPLDAKVSFIEYDKGINSVLAR